MTKLQNDSGSIESLTGGLSFRAQTMVNNNLDFSLEEGAIAGTTLEGGLHTFGNDVWGVNPIFTWATGRGYSGAFAWNARQIYPAYAAAIGLDTARNVFSLAEITAGVAKAEQELAATPDASRQSLVNWVKSSIIAPQSPYAVMILSGQRGEIAVYEATTATDRAAGMDKGASIAANTSITIDAGDFRNNVSKVSTASGDITIEAATFENVGRTLYERSTVKWGRGFTNNSKNKGVYSEGNGQEVLLTPVGYAYGSINAGGKVNLAAGQVRNGVSENLGVAGTGSAVGIVSPTKPGSLGQNVPSVTDIIGSLPATGLFSVNATPGHHYLVETNPALTNMSTFYGSDYFLSRSGLDLDKLNMQLLGDAFYETTLVREQVFALTGKRLLSSSVTSDAEQMQALMDSALRAQTSLNLTVGVALTEAQLAQLTEDIVWLEKTVVDGHEVLAPKVYLASASLEKIAQGGSVIVGKDVAITTTGDTSNAGVIQAANTLTITAANIFNTSGALQGQNVALAATGSIANTSGSISGGDVTLSAGKSITVDTGTVTFASANTTSVVAGTRGSVAASGALSMTAGEKIAVTGADVSAGGAASLTAGKTVSIAAQQTSNSSNTSGTGFHASNSLADNQAATLTSGGALAVTAGEDLLVHGSTVRAGGDASLVAGGDLSITSAANTEEFSRSMQSKGGGLFGGKSSESASGSSSTNVASQVSAGGTLTAEAGKAGTGDLVVSGSELSATQDVNLGATGNVVIAAAQTTSSGQYESSSSGFGGFISSSGSKENRKVTTERSDITAGEDIAIKAQKDITLTAAKITSGGETTLTADSGKVSILTSKDSEYNRSVSSNVGWLTWSSADKGKSAEIIVNTLITTGKGLTITSRDGVTVEYNQTGDLRQDIQQLSKAQGLEWMGELLKRDDVNWKGVQEQYESWNKKDGGLSPAATIVLAIAASAAAGVFAPEFAGTILGIGKGASATMLALQSALAARITATAANVTVAAANAAAGGDFGKNMEALVSEEGVRSLLASMVLAGAMNQMGTSFKDPKFFAAEQRVLATTLVKTLTSTVVGGQDLEKAFLTALGSSFDSNILGEIDLKKLQETERLILVGALGAAGAKLTDGDPLQGAISSMAVEMADWIKATPLTEKQKAEGAKYAEMSQCSYSDDCMSKAGYTRISDDDLHSKVKIVPNKLIDPTTGLHAALFEKNGEVVFVVRGTAVASDWLTNVSQAFFGVGAQYTKIANDGETLGKIQQYAQKSNSALVATGHSMGGGVATLLVSTSYFDKAVVFNPAGVSNSTFAAVKGDKKLAQDKTTAYVSRGDILTSLQDIVPFLIQKAIGTRVLMDAAGLHNIDPVVSALNSK